VGGGLLDGSVGAILAVVVTAALAFFKGRSVARAADEQVGDDVQAFFFGRQANAAHGIPKTPGWVEKVDASLQYLKEGQVQILTALGQVSPPPPGSTLPSDVPSAAAPPK
jgi:hypothetical protein